MAKLPAIQFYPGDWLQDAVAGCSLAAQGLWLRMMFLAHNSDEYGYLSADRVPLLPTAIAQRCGCLSMDQFTSLLDELETAKVFSRTTSGIIFSRRMVRDAKLRKQNSFRQQDYRNKNKTKENSNALVTPLSHRSSSSSSTTEQEQIQPPHKQRTVRAFSLPDWIPHLVWEAYIEMRKRKGKAPTPFALELVTKKLHGFMQQGHDPGAVLEQSIRSGWTDVYPVRDGGNYAAGGGNSANKSQQRTDGNRAAARKAIEMLGITQSPGGDAADERERGDTGDLRGSAGDIRPQAS